MLGRVYMQVNADRGLERGGG